MAKCACGADTPRLRITIREDGTKAEACPACKPEDFPASEPAWKRERPAMGWEARPNMYRKTWAEDGLPLYTAKDELRADTEAEMIAAANRSYEEALERKRKHRRTSPLTKEELAVAKKKAYELLVPEEKRKQEEYDRCMAEWMKDTDITDKLIH